MTAFEIFREYGLVILVFAALAIAGVYAIYFISRRGLKGVAFIGKDVEELGVVNGGHDRPKDSITVYKLTDKKSRRISWCLNVITKSRYFQGVGRFSGEIPLFLDQEEMDAIISTFEQYRG